MKKQTSMKDTAAALTCEVVKSNTQIALRRKHVIKLKDYFTHHQTCKRKSLILMVASINRQR